MARVVNVPLVWLFGEVKTPPFSAEARVEAGFLLRRLQQGETLGLPQSRPMPTSLCLAGQSTSTVFVRPARRWLDGLAVAA